MEMKTNFKEELKSFNCVEDTKKYYKTNAKKYHPDIGGTEEEFKLLNSEYLLKLKSLDGSKYKDREYNYTYKADLEEPK